MSGLLDGAERLVLKIKYKRPYKNVKAIKYRLHGVVRKQQIYKLNTKLKTIFIAYDTTILSKEVKRLRDEFGYSVQLEIIH